MTSLTDIGSEQTPPAAPRVAAGETCPACAARMTEDQRYCLFCGERRGATRVPFPPAQESGETAAPAPVLTAAPVARRGATATWVTAVGVLLLAMGVGVLIGHNGEGDTPAAAPAPVTLTVPTGAPAATATPDPAADAGARAGKGKDAKGKGGATKGKGASAPVSPASKEDLQQLENLSPEQYNKESKALPDNVGTSGTPVPKDDKPAGGGGGFEEIG
jgi:hypothetical protein